MTRVGVSIREPRAGEFMAWNELWKGYLSFYRSDYSVEHAEHLWRRINDESDPISCYVAHTDGALIGLVHYLPHADTWDDRPTCYLQDLFVSSAERGMGTGTRLIEAVAQRARSEGWSGVYWLTAADNERARRVYDQVTGGPTEFIVYDLEFEG